MSKPLIGLGYKPKYRHDGRYPSEKWERITSNGYDVQELIFDTIHGGPWTFECHAKRFILDSECNWTAQERIEFNPASRDFISCTTGKWMREPVVLTADECMAISDHISMLERKRKLREEGESE